MPGGIYILYNLSTNFEKRTEVFLSAIIVLMVRPTGFEPVAYGLAVP